MNKAIIIGRLTRDIELKITNSGKSVCSFSVAVDRGFKDQDGNKQTDFIDCVAWGATAENLATYQGKGSQIAIDGRIQVRSYEAQDGSKRKAVEVVAERIEFIGSKPKAEPAEDDGWDSMGTEVVF